MLPELDPDKIQDVEEARQVIRLLLNLLEEYGSENESLRTKMQALRDEVNRLKGEQGKPDVSLNVTDNAKRLGDDGYEVSLKVTT